MFEHLFNDKRSSLDITLPRTSSMTFSLHLFVKNKSILIKVATPISGTSARVVAKQQMRLKMADTMLLRSLAAKSVNLSSKKLEKVPKIIGRLINLLQLELKNNKLTQLPDEFRNLIRVSTCTYCRAYNF